MTSLRNSIAALAVSLPLVASAQEAPKPPLAQIYGTLNLNLQYTQAGDATDLDPTDAEPAPDDVTGRFALSTDSSNIGVRGTFDTGQGVNVVYQCETSANLDGIGVTGLCNRNSRIGLSGFWGTLFYGSWDTPFKSAHYGTKADDPFGNTDVFGFNAIFGSPGFLVRTGSWVNTYSATGNTVAGFDLRAGNSVAYWTPKFSGLSAKVQWGTNEFRTADGVVDPTLLSAAVNYDMAGLSVFATGEYHEDSFGLRQITGENAVPNTSKDMAWRAGAGYELPLGVGSLNVMAMIEQLLYKQDDAPLDQDSLEDFDRMAWLVGAKFRTGNHEFRARYGQALKPNCTLGDGTDCPDEFTDELGAQNYAVGYAYHLAKTTQVYAYFTQIMNDDFAQYTFTVGGSPAVTSAGGAANPPGAPLPGQDPLAGGVGIRYAS
jgi:predicted porin